MTFNVCRFNVWTNNLYKSTVHRVINNSAGFRTSVPFFLEPNFDALVKPLPISVADAGVC
jgi:isopenicillin N synthase-like dioxygenase